MASRWPKRVLIGVGVVVVGLAALHAVNHARLDAGALRANVAPILAEARALGGKAKPEYQELALATLPPNPRTGEYFLDDMLDRAVVRQAPPAATVDNAVIQALEFDDPAAPGSSPPRTAPRWPCATARSRWSTTRTITSSTPCRSPCRATRSATS